MKRFKIAVAAMVCIIMMIAMTGCHEVPGVMTITFENRSSEDVYVRYTVTSLSHPRSSDAAEDLGLTRVKRGKSIRITQWENDYVGAPRTVAELIRKATLDSYLHSDRSMPLNADINYRYTYRELEAMNFKIIYTGE